MPEGTPPREFFTRVVGVTYENEDGSSRQRIIEKCRVGDDMRLEWQPDNPHDANAIAVRRRPTGEQIGYLAREVAARAVEQMQAGTEFSAEIHEIRGGGFLSGKSLGVVLRIGVYDPVSFD